MPLDFLALAQQCAPQISPITMAAIVRTESDFNPYAIGVVHGRLLRQPANAVEATATARALETGGWSFSVGLAQVNRTNWSAHGLTEQNAFEPCRNLTAGAAILQGCFASAHRVRSDAQDALRASLSCYASGDFSMGYRVGYVQRVVDNAAAPSMPALPESVPAIVPIPVIPASSAPIRSIRSPPSRQTATDRDHEASGQKQGEPDSSAVVF